MAKRKKVVVPVVGMEKDRMGMMLTRIILEHDGIVEILFSNGSSMRFNQIKTGTLEQHRAGIKRAWDSERYSEQPTGMDDESRRLLAKILPTK